MKNYYELYDEIIRNVLASFAPPCGNEGDGNKPPVEIKFDKKMVKEKLIEEFKKEFLGRHTISFQSFEDREFNNDQEVEELYRTIKNDYPLLSPSIPVGGTEWLNKFLQIGCFYDNLKAKHRRIEFDKYTKQLIQETSLYRRNYFQYLGGYKQMKIIRLNRLLLEAVYPKITPKFMDYFFSAKVSYYMGPYAKEAFRDVFFDDIEKRYFLDYRVADVALQHEGIYDLMQIDYKKIIGQHAYSKEFSKFSQHIYHRAVVDIPLLLVGETGTGKELCARAIHLISKRRQAPFVEINCTAIPETLLESELFGVIKDYPGFQRNMELKGKILAANGGTVFLDEIGKMPKNLQAKILKVIEDKNVSKLGSDEVKKIDIRFIAAVQPKDIKEDNILPDLKYRLGYPDIVIMPTLKERMNELGETLLNISLNRTIKKMRTVNPDLKIDPALIDNLKSRTYEGNFRELEGIYRMAILDAKAEATPEKYWPVKFDDFCAGLYVNKITEKNIRGLDRVVIDDQPLQGIKKPDNSFEQVPLKSIVECAEKEASKIIEERVKKIVSEGRNIKDVLISEGVSEKEYQNVLGKIKRYMGKGINDMKKSLQNSTSRANI